MNADSSMRSKWGIGREPSDRRIKRGSSRTRLNLCLLPSSFQIRDPGPILKTKIKTEIWVAAEGCRRRSEPDILKFAPFQSSDSIIPRVALHPFDGRIQISKVAIQLCFVSGLQHSTQFRARLVSEFWAFEQVAAQ